MSHGAPRSFEELWPVSSPAPGWAEWGEGPGVSGVPRRTLAGRRGRSAVGVPSSAPGPAAAGWAEGAGVAFPGTPVQVDSSTAPLPLGLGWVSP